MPELTHMAMCTKNHRRLARFYNIVFGMEEVWNEDQNSPYSFYIGDGYFQLNCLQIRSGSGRVKIVDGREIFPDVGINHIGFQVKTLEEVGKKLQEMTPAIEMEQSRPDGRYEEVRFDDPEGNPLELSRIGWPAGSGAAAPKVRHVGIAAKDVGRLAEFYKHVFSMKEIGRSNNAIYLSDGFFNLALVQNSPIPQPGINALGFKVSSIDEVEERVAKTMRSYTYKGEKPIAVTAKRTDGGKKAASLEDPDGNRVEISEGGWQV